MKLESKFQSDLKKKLKRLFPGAIVIKTDADQVQGIPDLLILYNDRWGALECKRSSAAPLRPNQQYYVEKMNEMSFASVIFPENEEEVLNGLQSALRPNRTTRISGSK